MKRLLTVLTACASLVLIDAPAPALAQQAQVSTSRANRSAPLRDVANRDRPAPEIRAPFAVPNKLAKVKPSGQQEGPAVTDPVVQLSAGTLAPSIGANFDGSTDADNSALLGFAVVPPDTDGDVGPNHYVQWINLVSEIFDKNGNTLLGPFAGNDYFAGLGGDCDTNNNGDPITLYDEAADRWLVSQFAVDSSPYSMCVAISESSDPTGSYHQYEFDFGTDFPDYPKLGVWGDSYTMTTRDFGSGLFYAGLSAVALDRDAMLNGDPATMVRFADAFGGTAIDGYLPADADDSVTGPALFGGHGDDGDTTFELWELDVDWTNPGAATFTPITGVGISSFDGIVPSVDQPNGQVLDDHSFFTMHRLNVRDFGTHMSMVANHTVETDPGTSGIRWYEFRNTGGNWTLHQEGTYSPDSDDRWMGSIAMNGNGDISLGYSRSSSSMFPSIYFTGQTADQSGTGIMNVAETLIFAGTGSQEGASRWGDYSKMSVDPVDDNTFWYTTEYYETTSSFNFKTRIASFVLDDDPGGNNSPVASFTSSCTLLSCDFTDSSTDSDGTIVGWDWDFGDTNTSTAQNPSHTYAAGGTYTVGLTVTDDMGATGFTSASVTVDDGTGPSTMYVSALSSAVILRTGAEVTVTILNNEGAAVEGATVTGTFSGETSGMPSAVTNANGEALLVSNALTTRPNSVDLCINDVTHASLTYDPALNADPAFSCEPVTGPPTAAFTFSTTGLMVDFTDTSTDGGSIVGWDWDFGDGNGSADQNPSHTYGADGTYPVMLTVTDNDGETGSTSKDVTVSESGGSTMHVEVISAATLVRGGGTGTAEITVTIHDESGNGVADATVTGTYSGDVSGNPSAVTNSSGQAVLVSNSFSTRPGTVDLCVNDVTHAGLTYDPAQNADAGFACTSAPAAKLAEDGPTVNSVTLDNGLEQNFPNPFRGPTIIRYSVKEANHVSVRVFNMLGQEVAVLKDGFQESGIYQVGFDATDLAAGVYLYTLRAGEYQTTRRMLVGE